VPTQKGLLSLGCSSRFLSLFVGLLRRRRLASAGKVTRLVNAIVESQDVRCAVVRLGELVLASHARNAHVPSNLAAKHVQTFVTYERRNDRHLFSFRALEKEHLELRELPQD